MSQLSLLLDRIQQINNSPAPVPKRKSKIRGLSYDKILADAKKNIKAPWRGSSVQQLKSTLHVIPGKVLDNWQIDRVLLAQRSFAKHQMDVKVAFKQTFFNKPPNTDKEGHKLMFYQSELPKLQRLREKINFSQIGTTPTAKRHYFGLSRINKQKSQFLNRKQTEDLYMMAC